MTNEKSLLVVLGVHVVAVDSTEYTKDVLVLFLQLIQRLLSVLVAALGCGLIFLTKVLLCPGSESMHFTLPVHILADHLETFSNVCICVCK